VNLTKVAGVGLGLVVAGLLVTALCAPAGGTRGATPGNAAAPPDPRAALFVKRGCNECHAIAALGVRAATDAAPDLTFAYADVMIRYGVTLEYFLFNPTGVMRLVLAAHVALPVADRDSIIGVLKRLYEDRRADMDEDMPSVPPARPLPRTGAAGPDAAGRAW
jgi:hypothetical protein